MTKPSAHQAQKLADVVGVPPEFLVGLDVHLPGSAELVEVVHIVRAEVDLERIEKLADRHAKGHTFRPVDVQEEPRGIGP